MMRKQMLIVLFLGFVFGSYSAFSAVAAKPNFIVLLADDMGWGDVGYNGNTDIHTPELDKMAGESMMLTRAYSAHPTCTPSRYAMLTGRAPRRSASGVNVGHMADEEITIAEILKNDFGYRTAFYGKWHLGVLAMSEPNGHRGGIPAQARNLMRPDMQGFDEYLASESNMITHDPYLFPIFERWNFPPEKRDAIIKETMADTSGKELKWPVWNAPNNSWPEIVEGQKSAPSFNYYWKGPEEKETENISGSTAKLLMDRAVDFIDRSHADEKPFMIQLWFHVPHVPLCASKEAQELYKGRSIMEQAYFGSITAMDTQIGRLRRKLRELNIAENTLIVFTSDNGAKSPERDPGSVKDLRGGKATLWEGGIRVPGIIEWPAVIKEPVVTDVPVVGFDYFPTLIAALGYEISGYPLDGVNMLPLLKGEMTERPAPWFHARMRARVIQTGKYKALRDAPKVNRGELFPWQVFDLENDRCESTDIANQVPEMIEQWNKQIDVWEADAKASFSGEDFPIKYELIKLKQ